MVVAGKIEETLTENSVGGWQRTLWVCERTLWVCDRQTCKLCSERSFGRRRNKTCWQATPSKSLFNIYNISNITYILNIWLQLAYTYIVGVQFKMTNIPIPLQDVFYLPGAFSPSWVDSLTMLHWISKQSIHSVYLHCTLLRKERCSPIAGVDNPFWQTDRTATLIVLDTTQPPDNPKLINGKKELMVWLVWSLNSRNGWRWFIGGNC